MLINDKSVEKIKANPVKGILDICENVLVLYEMQPDVNELQPDFLDALALVSEALSLPGVPSFAVAPELTGDPETDCARISKYLGAIQRDLREVDVVESLEQSRQYYSSLLNRKFVYEFSEGDLNRVQKLLNELRDLVTDSDLFAEDHKQRLLLRLEKLQGELHKKVSDLDRFWGLVGDAGVAVGKFGSDAKPFVDRIREITSIVWKTQARKEELPSDAEMPALSHRESE